MAEPASSPYRWLVAIFAAMCVVFAVASQLSGAVAQDGAAYVAAGRLVLAGSDQIYPQMGESPEMSAAFQGEYCALVTGDLPCDQVIVPFISTPALLPLVAALGALPGAVGVFVLRLLAAICLGWGMWVLSERIAGENPAARRVLGLSALALVTVAPTPIETGQSAPWLFAAAVAGWAARSEDWSEAVPTGALLAGGVLTKISPAMLLAPLLWSGRLKTMAVCAALVGACVAITPFLPGSPWSDSAAFYEGFAPWVLGFAQNASSDASLSRLVGTGSAFWVARVVKAALVLGALAFAVRSRVPHRDLWLLTWGAWMLLVPVVWGHYIWVGVALLLGVVLPRADERSAWAVLAAVLCLLPAQFLEIGAPLAHGATLWLAGVYGTATWVATRPA